MFATPPPLQEKRPDIPVPLAELVHRMLAKEPKARPTASQVAGLLAKLGTPQSSQQELQSPTIKKMQQGCTSKENSLTSLVQHPR